MRGSRRLVFAVSIIFALVGSLSAVAVGAPASRPLNHTVARTVTHRLDLSSRAKINTYLRSIGVNPARAVFQRGPRNYAGPNCPGARWNCTSADAPVVQLAAAGGPNTFACASSPPGSAPSPPDTCIVIQMGSGPNTATCTEYSTLDVVTQTCDITQVSAGTDSQASIQQTIVTKDAVSPQDAH